VPGAAAVVRVCAQPASKHTAAAGRAACNQAGQWMLAHPHAVSRAPPEQLPGCTRRVSSMAMLPGVAQGAGCSLRQRRSSPRCTKVGRLQQLPTRALQHRALDQLPAALGALQAAGEHPRPRSSCCSTAHQPDMYPTCQVDWQAPRCRRASVPLSASKLCLPPTVSLSGAALVSDVDAAR
jgi:hypothetical protein